MITNADRTRVKVAMEKFEEGLDDSEDVYWEDPEDLSDKESVFVEEQEQQQETEQAKAQKQENPNDDFPDLAIEKIVPLEHPTKSAVGQIGEASDLRIINTQKSGKRIVLKQNVISELNLEQTLQVGLIKDTLVMAKEDLSETTSYTLRKQGKAYAIYNTKLIDDITKALGLDFSKCSTLNLNIKYTTKNETRYLMAQNNNLKGGR